MIPKLHKDFLENAIEILKKDKRIKGIATGGSYITGEMDEYSDVDLVIAINDSDFLDVMNTREKIANSLGNLLSSFTGEHVGEPRLLICLYGEECLHVDLKFVALSDISKRVEDPCILWEEDMCISNELIKESAKFPIPDLQWFEDRFWIWVHYGATKIGRGELFEVIDFISFLRQNVIGPLILMKSGELPKGVRKLEFVALDSIDKLKRTVPSYSKESCIDSLNLIIQMYLELRKPFISSDFNERHNAQKYSLEYLEYVSKI